VALAPLVQLMGIAIPVYAFFLVEQSLLRTFKDARSYVMVSSILLPGLRLGLVLIGFALAWSLVGIIAGYFIVPMVIVALVALGPLARIGFTPRRMFAVHSRELWALLLFSAPLLIGTLFGQALWQTDVILLQRYSGGEQAGYYSAALTVARLMSLILIALSFSTAPIMARLYTQERFAEMQQVYGQIADIIFAMTLPILALMICFAPLILSVLFGTAYQTGAVALQILALAYFIHNVLGPSGNTLVMTGRSRAYLVSTVGAALISVAAYYLLIPTYQLVGAAVGTLLGLLFLNGFFSVQLYRVTGINPVRYFRWKLLPIVVVASGIALAAERFLITTAMPQWLQLILVTGTVCGIYGVIAVAIGIIKPATLRSLRRLSRRT
jgi:O-antigen/teichoic acid export membrane protein